MCNLFREIHAIICSTRKPISPLRSRTRMAIGLSSQQMHHGKHRKYSYRYDRQRTTILIFPFFFSFFTDLFGKERRLCWDTVQLISSGTFRRERKLATIAFDTLVTHGTYWAAFMIMWAHRNHLLLSISQMCNAKCMFCIRMKLWKKLYFIYLLFVFVCAQCESSEHNDAVTKLVNSSILMNFAYKINLSVTQCA